MTIIKIAHRDTPYVTIRRETVQDETLSWEARGMLAYLLSKPLDWTVRPSQLQQCCGRDKVYGILRELSEHGYVTRTDKRDANGRVLEVEYVVYEVAENPLPFPEKPYTVNPNTENHPLQIKEITKEREYTSPNGASATNESQETPDNETSSTLEVVSPLESTPTKPSTRKQKNTVAAAPRPRNPIFDALVATRFGSPEISAKTAKHVGSLAGAAWDEYALARAALVATLSDAEARARCALGVVAFEGEWKKRTDKEGKPLGAIQNPTAYAREFRTFLDEHAPRTGEPLTPRAVSSTATPPRFSTPDDAGELFPQKVSEGGDE